MTGVNERNQYGTTALMKAAAHNTAVAAEELLAAGADTEITNEDGLSALGFAAVNDSADVARLLIEAGADVNRKDDSGYTPLMIAAEENSLKVAELLIEAGAELNAVNEDGKSALAIAVENRSHDVKNLLFDAGADIIRKKREETFGVGGLGTGKEKGESGGTDGKESGKETAESAELGEDDSDDILDFKILSYLPGPIAKSAPLPKNLVGTLYGGHGGDCLAMETSFTKESEPTGVSLEEPAEQVMIFKNLDPFINGTAGKPEIKALRRLEDDDDEDDVDGVVIDAELWLSMGVNQFLEEREGKNLSKSYRDFKLNYYRYKIKRRFSWIKAAREKDKETAMRIANYLMAAGVDVNAKNEYAQTALLQAVNERLEFGVKLLIRAGADVNALNGRDETALMRAAFLGEADFVDLLIRNGADVNLQDSGGWTALMYAARKNAVDCVKSLLGAGAIAGMKNNKGETALSIAQKKGAADAARILL